MHTVPSSPSPQQREIVETLSQDAARMVLLSTAAHRFLAESYRVDHSRVEVILHGAAFSPTGKGTHRSRTPLLFTWGLLGPGKGLEWAIEAMAILRQSHPRARLIISGRTHPKVLEREGEAYRHSLQDLVHHLDLDRHVCFIDQYVSREAIDRLLARASVVLLPYDSTDQTSSGVLAEAITAGVPVVATAFPQALEMEAEGATVTVPHQAPRSIAAAVAQLIESPTLAQQMVLAQRAVSGATTWEVVGDRYLRLVEEVTAGAAA